MRAEGPLETRQRLLATGAAENRVCELRARRVFPDPATTSVAATQGNLDLVITQIVTTTPNPTIRRIDLSAADARSPDRVLAKLTAYVAQ